MGMTMTQKILAAHAGLEKVEAGQLIEAELDLVLGNDITSPVAIHEMEKMKAEGVFHKDKIALVMDHFIPNKDIKSAENCKCVREFAARHEITNYFDVGEMGIEHALLPESGLTVAGDAIIGADSHTKCVREFAARHEITNYFDVGEMGIEHALLPESGLTVAGDAIIGADSHTCTYGALGAFSTGVGSTDMAAAMVTGKAWFKVPSAIRINLIGKPSKWVSGKDVILHLIGKIGVDGALYKSLEFTGEGVKNLSMDDRFTIANMAIEAGAKNGIFPVDEKTEEYMKEHSKRPYKRYEPDEDAVYDEEYTIMAIEAGAKNGIFPVDEKTEEYMKEHSKRPYKRYEPDEDAVYDEEYTIDLSKLRPTVAFPHLPSNTKTIDEIQDDVIIQQSVIGSCTNGRIDDLRCAAQILKNRKVKKGVRCIIIPDEIQDDVIIQQSVIGSCTNGRIDDLRCAAQILKNRKVKKGVRCIIIPATQKIYLQALEEGLLKIFIEAGAVVSTPTCGPCLGGYMGILAEGERCISTTNRNFVGRMGHVKSEVYLASPAVAAASAITGKISSPEELGE